MMVEVETMVGGGLSSLACDSQGSTSSLLKAVEAMRGEWVELNVDENESAGEDRTEEDLLVENPDDESAGDDESGMSGRKDWEG